MEKIYADNGFAELKKDFKFQPFDVKEMNEEQRKAEHTEGKAFSLIVHTKGTERSYQIEVAPPKGKSYASKIAQKYGVTYEMLVK